MLLLLAACGGGGIEPFLEAVRDASTELADPSNPIDVRAALGGESTVAPQLVDTGVVLDTSTVVAAQTVRLFEFDADDRYRSELTADEFVAFAEGTYVVVLPLRPLEPGTCYLAVLTRDVRDEDGRRLRRTRRVRDLEGTGKGAGTVVRQLLRAAWRARVPLRTVARVHAFRTLRVRETLAAVHGATIARPIQLAPTGLSTDQLGLPAGADIYVGTLEVPSYLDPTDPLGSFWDSNDDRPLPTQRGVITIPLIMTVPNADSGFTKPTDGWDVVIYQHGITRVRTDMLAVAGAMAAAGQATIAIDLPLHGVTDRTNPFYQAGRERTYDFDLVDNATLAPGPDGLIDESGTFFINLQNLLNFRDNGRQAISDLFTLTRSIPSIDYDGGGPDCDANDIRFFGLSLGGIIGTPYVALEDGIDAVSLGMAGGGVARLLEASSFGPLLQGGLAAQGILPGSPAYEFYLDTLQAVFDAADPLNFAIEAAAKHPIHLMQMRDDPTVPNAVPLWPLAGTEPLAALMGLAPVTTTVSDPAGVRGFVIFTADFGVTHQPQLQPEITPRVTVEMVSSTAAFLASGGTLLPVFDSGALE
ncbi:MAG: hypothetical protein AAGD14_03890 [Planctomycetota bacterium]